MRILGFLLLSFTLALHASGQERARDSSTDTTSVDKPILFDPGISIRRPSLVIPPLFEADILFREPLFLLPQQRFGASPPFLEKPALAAIDIMIPWHLQMERERRLRPLQSFLATVQIGGVAYLAYEHIRKHGLFK